MLAFMHILHSPGSMAMNSSDAIKVTSWLPALALAACVVLLSVPARADAIDGDWCSADNKLFMSIKGPEILTPGGSRAQGDYTRHTFAYTVPPADPNAGQAVAMQLLNENTVSLRMAAAANLATAPAQTWHRCARPISARGTDRRAG
jgi:hypothetical protein